MGPSPQAQFEESANTNSHGSHNRRCLRQRKIATPKQNAHAHTLRALRARWLAPLATPKRPE
ncbi:MAG: hypothetical protein HC767_04880 [Akkermansiaceae bacterium]|nr:hypothetical protein [Akkermansiaceae bacterium]